ncbi:MAG: hypothetical protein D6693_10030 [Planctomycetota bacterium]|nr:MAG: hypothetical protein D6693_10030 [Planctomycetota bacterium]
MRWLVNIVAVLLALALGAGVVLHGRTVRREQEAVREVRAAVRQIERELRRRSATGSVEVNGRGWPITVEPAWFGASPPVNRLLPPDRPWIEIAPPEHKDYLHPVVRQSYNEHVPAFWYNPALGIVRARVPVMVSDRLATELYNEVNTVAIASIFEGLPIPEREPERADNAVAGAGGMSEDDLDPTKPIPPG